MAIEIIHGDALDQIRQMPDGCIDAIVTDPPYCSGGFTEAAKQTEKGQGLRSENIKRDGWFEGDNMTTGGLVFLIRQLTFESIRLFKNGGGSFLIFADWRMVPMIAPAIESAGIRYQNMLIWAKPSPGLGHGFRAQHETILHFTAGKPVYHDKGTGNVLRAKRVLPSAKYHPAQKPIDLLETLISVVCPEGGTVMDWFGGSGAVGIAAERIGRDAVLIDRDPKHIKTMQERITRDTQTGLFK